MSNIKPFKVKLSGSEKYQRLFSAPEQTLGLKAGFVNLKPQEEIGEHSTDNREEAIIIIKGMAQVFYADNESLTAEEGSVVYMPPNTKHNLKNIGDTVLSYVFVVAPIKQPSSAL